MNKLLCTTALTKPYGKLVEDATHTCSAHQYTASCTVIRTRFGVREHIPLKKGLSQSEFAKIERFLKDPMSAMMLVWPEIMLDTKAHIQIYDASIVKGKETISAAF